MPYLNGIFSKPLLLSGHVITDDGAALVVNSSATTSFGVPAPGVEMTNPNELDPLNLIIRGEARFDGGVNGFSVDGPDRTRIFEAVGVGSTPVTSPGVHRG